MFIENIQISKHDDFLIYNNESGEIIQSAYNEYLADKACAELNAHEVRCGRKAVYVKMPFTEENKKNNQGYIK